jgi:O-methyltransferase
MGPSDTAGDEDREGPVVLYLELLKRCLTRYDFEPPLIRWIPPKRNLIWSIYNFIRRLLTREDLVLARKATFDPVIRAEGRDHPPDAETMIGLRRLDNLEACCTQVIRDNIPGDFIETGVWRGGACIFMRGILKAYGDRHRKVYVADSFRGLPPPQPDLYPADRGDRLHEVPHLAVSLDAVKANFTRYGLLDEQVDFVQGWFCDTLPRVPTETLAILRLDGDLYQSTMEALTSLYPKLSVGGFVIIDDYGAVPACKTAVEDFRQRHHINEPFVHIDWSGIFWRKGYPANFASR